MIALPRYMAWATVLTFRTEEDLLKVSFPNIRDQVSNFETTMTALEHQGDRYERQLIGI